MFSLNKARLRHDVDIEKGGWNNYIPISFHFLKPIL